MLRVYGPKDQPDEEATEPEDNPEEEAQEPEEAKPSSNVDKLDQSTVAYKTPDQGPFKCANCLYFQKPNACDMVDGEIHPEGYCNIFVKIEGVPMDEANAGMGPEAPAAGATQGEPPEGV